MSVTEAEWFRCRYCGTDYCVPMNEVTRLAQGFAPRRDCATPGRAALRRRVFQRRGAATYAPAPAP